jgi:hypothetical protein
MAKEYGHLLGVGLLGSCTLHNKRAGMIPCGRQPCVGNSRLRHKLGGEFAGNGLALIEIQSGLLLRKMDTISKSLDCLLCVSVVFLGTFFITMVGIVY